MVNKVILKWNGPGYYAPTNDGTFVHMIGGPHINEAQGLARLAGLDEKKVAHLSERPIDSKFLTVHDETQSET